MNKLICIFCIVLLSINTRGGEQESSALGVPNATCSISGNLISYTWDDVANAVYYQYSIDTATTWLTLGDGVTVFSIGTNNDVGMLIRAMNATETGAQTGYIYCNPSSAIVEVELDDKNKIYPNPFHAILHIDADRNAQVFELFDITGSKVFVAKISNVQTSIDLSHLPAGVYFTKISGKSRKVVKL